MGDIYNIIKSVFDYIVEYAILAIEFIGVIVLCYAVVRAIVGMFRKKNMVRLELAEGIALALEFKMGGELLRTVVVREWNELLILGSVILLRAALTFLIQWEIKNERKNAPSSTDNEKGNA